MRSPDDVVRRLPESQARRFRAILLEDRRTSYLEIARMADASMNHGKEDKKHDFVQQVLLYMETCREARSLVGSAQTAAGAATGSLDGAVAYWDTGEAQVVPWILGIAHSTGFPVFTLLGYAFSHIVALGPVSSRMALFSAVCASATTWLVWRIVTELSGAPWIACAAAWMFAFGEIVWARATRAEVHTLALLFALMTLYFAQRWYRLGEFRALYAGAFSWGLGIATHPLVAMLLPAVLLLFSARTRTVTVRNFALASALLACGVAFYAYLPLRSAYVYRMHRDPTLALGEPPGKPFWDNDHPSTVPGFLTEVTGADFDAPRSFAELLDAQTYASAIPYFAMLARELTPLGVILAAIGFASLMRRDPLLATAFTLAAAVPTGFAFTYQIEADVARYYMISFAVAATFAGYGAAAIASAFDELRAPASIAIAVAAAALVVWHADLFAQRYDDGAGGVIRAVRATTPDGAVLVAPWLYATPLAYGAYVDHSLGSRIVEVSWLQDDRQRVPIWLKSRGVYVVGALYGSVPGYEAKPVRDWPPIWRIVKR